MKEVKLQEICRIEKGKQIDTSQLRTDSPYKYINGGIKESGYYHEYNTDSEAVLVSEGGASCGYVNYVNEKFWCGCHCYKLTESKTLAKYLYYALKGNQDKIMELRSGAAMPNIKKDAFKNMSLLVDFDKNDQQAIVETLDCIQKAINNKTDELLSLDELVKSRFIEMFGDIDLSPQKAEWSKLSELGTIYTGTTPSTTDETNWDGNILWITPAEINDDSFFIDDTVRKITEKGMKSKSLSMMPVGTVLLSTRAPIGKVGIVAKSMTCNQGFKNFYCPSRVNSIYLYVILKNNTQYLNSIGTGTTFKEISKTTCGNIRVPVPPIELQNEFAEFVKLIDKSKFIVQQQIKDLQELLDSKMDEYFR